MKVEPLHLLFICSRNQWRSPTAEHIFKRQYGVVTRSAGTSAKAKRSVGSKDIVWADIIFVMEKKHRSRLAAAFADELNEKMIYILDIADDYQFMDPELVDELESKVLPVLEKLGADET